MTPKELSQRHPRLFHVTQAGAGPSIRSIGLLSTTSLLDLFGIGGARRAAIERTCRPAGVPLYHPSLGPVVITDQRPMTETALAQCLDDGLTPVDWLALLNARVFFWASEAGLARLLGARSNRTRDLDILVIDTLSLAEAYAETIEICPINSGATMRRPARRGAGTFTRLLAQSHQDWSRKRGRRDKILEVTVLGGVPDIARHVLEVRPAPAASR